jgi:hypothetical protein
MPSFEVILDRMDDQKKRLSVIRNQLDGIHRAIFGPTPDDGPKAEIQEAPVSFLDRANEKQEDIGHQITAIEGLVEKLKSSFGCGDPNRPE